MKTNKISLELSIALAGVIAAGILEYGLAEKAGWFILPAIIFNGVVRVYIFQKGSAMERHSQWDADIAKRHSQAVTWGFVIYIGLVLFWPDRLLEYDKQTWYGFFLFCLTAYSLYVVEWVFTKWNTYGDLPEVVEMREEFETEILALQQQLADEKEGAIARYEKGMLKKDQQIESLKQQIDRHDEEVEAIYERIREQQKEAERNLSEAQAQHKRREREIILSATRKISKERESALTKVREMAHSIEAERDAWESERERMREEVGKLSALLELSESITSDLERAYSKARRETQGLEAALSYKETDLTQADACREKAAKWEQVQHLLDTPILHGNRYKIVSSEAGTIIGLTGKNPPLMADMGKGKPAIPLEDRIQQIKNEKQYA